MWKNVYKFLTAVVKVAKPILTQAAAQALQKKLDDKWGGK